MHGKLKNIVFKLVNYVASYDSYYGEILKLDIDGQQAICHKAFKKLRNVVIKIKSEKFNKNIARLEV